ncbi:MAG: helix-turn-helix transcriptional regulator [Chloroflexota bacterium]
MADEGGLRRLSLSETRVARLVAEGLADEQIADRLGITAVDVMAELAEVFRKLGLRSRTELALLAPEPRRTRRQSRSEGNGRMG